VFKKKNYRAKLGHPIFRNNIRFAIFHVYPNWKPLPSSANRRGETFVRKTYTTEYELYNIAESVFEKLRFVFKCRPKHGRVIRVKLRLYIYIYMCVSRPFPRYRIVTVPFFTFGKYNIYFVTEYSIRSSTFGVTGRTVFTISFARRNYFPSDSLGIAQRRNDQNGTRFR